MLEFENQLLVESFDENQLAVIAKGIPLDKVYSGLFKLYATEENLVFVLSTNSNEEKYFKRIIPDGKIYSITAETNPNERTELYHGGGLFFITSRIMIVDLLKEVVPIENITGLILLRTHNIIDTSQEAFILRLYRSKNKTGFIKAFSQSPNSFLIGYSRINKVMRCCFLKNISLWPRFHASIKEDLSKNKKFNSSVIEMQLKLTEEMSIIQSNLLDLINVSISELKRLVPSLNDEDISTENALTESFHKIIDDLMDPVWNTVIPKSKDILNDLKIFKQLLINLTKTDCITFYSLLCQYTSAEAVYKYSWILTDSAEKIITASRLRFLPKPTSNSLKRKANETEASSSTSTNNNKSWFKPELHPKWSALSEILHEVCIKEKEKEEVDEGDKDMFSDEEEEEDLIIRPSRVKTMIFVEDVRTCAVLKDFLVYGSEVTLGKLAKRYENIKIDIPSSLNEKINSIEYNKKGAKNNNKKNLTKGADDEEKESKNKEVQMTLTQINRKYEDVQFLTAPVFIYPVKNFGETVAYSLSNTLDEIKPDIIILFDPTLELVRNIEVYNARYGDSKKIQVYFLAFHNSVEEQIYLTTIQREKLAFEKLIQEKKTMMVPNEREGRDDLNQDLWRDPTKANEAVGMNKQSKRNMDKNDTNERRVILVDMREFRSDLPSLIHKRGIDIEPLTLDIGDYILTPDICVERKSISDLVGSLNSGRLYKQAEAMCRHYKKPILLIEHEVQAQKGIGSIYFKNELAQTMPKLQILTLTFPKLKILWSSNAAYTAEIFQELKKNKKQPLPEMALSIQKDESGVESKSNYSQIAHSFLSKLPGIDSRNVYTILNRCNNLKHLASLSEDEISSIVGNINVAGILHTGIHSNLIRASKEANNNSNPTTNKGIKQKGFRGKFSKNNNKNKK